MENFEIDETKLSQQDLDYLDQLLYNRFQVAKSIECKQILNIRERLGLDIEENYMHSDFENEYNKKYNRIINQ